MKHLKRSLFVVLVLSLILSVSAVLAHDPDDPDDGTDHQHSMLTGGERRDPSAALSAQDAIAADVVSSGPFAKVTKNLAAIGNGERNVSGATTDVWAHDGYAYTGTFNSPCGGDPEAGVWVWDVHNKNKVSSVGVIQSPVGSRANDVKVATMNSGDILVHSNESCGGGPGGFEIYNVDDPADPVHLAHVQTDDVNALLRDAFGFVDFGVHNLFLFTQGDKDYVGAVVESEFGNFQIFDITDPAAPSLVGFWGAESLLFPNVDFATTTDFGGVILPADDYLFSGFGASMNRFLHDITITADGTKAYLSNWDAGLVLLDISDPSDPSLVSVALDLAGSPVDGEVNSHAAWPSEDGSVVIETEEDFSALAGDNPLSNFTFQELPTNTIPGVGISTNAGTDFENNPTGNNVTVDADSVTVNSGPLAGNVYEANEGSGNQPKFADVGPVTGEAVWIGRACTGDPIENAASFNPGDIAIARRGACFFSEKLANAAALGASAIVIANNQPDTPWGGVRIWDYADPANPVLASTFNTVCSLDPTASQCDPAGTYSVHNVIVESTDDGQVKAYISWYWDGMLVLDITDPYNPLEVGRYTTSGEDYWGVYKVPGEPWIYGSDRNGGLAIFKELGSGSGKN